MFKSNQLTLFSLVRDIFGCLVFNGRIHLSKSWCLFKIINEVLRVGNAINGVGIHLKLTLPKVQLTGPHESSDFLEPSDTALLLPLSRDLTSEELHLSHQLNDHGSTKRSKYLSLVSLS